jgi:hypothetical protein
MLRTRKPHRDFLGSYYSDDDDEEEERAGEGAFGGLLFFWGRVTGAAGGFYGNCRLRRVDS